MSTVQRINFELTTSILNIITRDLPLADPTLIDPLSNANPLVDGEWIIIDANGKVIPAATRSAAGNVATQTGYPLWAETGRWDVQAMSQKKVPFLFLGEYEAETRIFDATAALSGGAAITFVGQPLKVASITLGSLVKVGLVGAVAGDGEPIVGRVTRLPANNGGKLRYVKAHTI